MARSLLATSGVSGKKAEPAFIARCELTNVDALASELEVSEASGKHHRADEQMRSAFSGMTGQKRVRRVLRDEAPPVRGSGSM